MNPRFVKFLIMLTVVLILGWVVFGWLMGLLTGSFSHAVSTGIAVGIFVLIAWVIWRLRII